MKAVLMVLLVLCAPASVAQDSNAALAAQVRATETAFAASMANRDLAAFSALIADDAIFFGPKALRGKPAVVEAWSAFFRDAKAPFSWRPETVEVLDTGTLALTHGPVFDPDGKQTGTFTSIWRRSADGGWKIVFDRGNAVCNCAAPP